ncbi:MAG: hypothetical protein AAFN77_12745 [Planctomycetota bacterium]
MGEFPFGYEKIAGTTWAYLSSLLMIALFFKFNRFWSVRNLDLLLIVLLVPGLLLVEGGIRQANSDAKQSINQATTSQDGTQLSDSELPAPLDSEVPSRDPDSTPKNDIDSDMAPQPTDETETTSLVNPFPTNPKTLQPIELNTDIADASEQEGSGLQRIGYIWLFSVGFLILIRLIIDPSLTRRPILEPNLSKGGLFFFGASLMAILTANLLLSDPTTGDIDHGKNAFKMIKREAADESDIEGLKRQGPGYPLFFMVPVLSTFENGEEVLETDVDEDANLNRFVLAAKIMAITSQSLIVLGLILFCYFNYDNLAVGVGTASIYLMLPYTALYTGHVTHTLPAALIVWAIVCFRRPWLAGVLVGLATGAAYYPIFLLPLWASFYWERGVRGFVIGLLVGLSICICGLIFTSIDGADFLFQLRQMFGFWQPRMTGLEGIWALGWSSWWRLPILVAFVAYAISFVAWPTEKNIGTLVSYTASILVAVQFWHGGSDGIGGGLYMAWYLPLLLLIVFRPNLTGRVALSELREPVRIKPETAEDLLPAA